MKARGPATASVARGRAIYRWLPAWTAMFTSFKAWTTVRPGKNQKEGPAP
ncbi:MAG: hypothetical protein P4L99_02245 [Chthoniobacter sp.]|nr:hypothetical protein [Chthoniobacter sp.]